MTTHRQTIHRSTYARVLLGALALLAAITVVVWSMDRAATDSRTNERVDKQLAREAHRFQRFADGADPDTGERFGQNISRLLDGFFEDDHRGPSEVALALVDGQPYALSDGARYPIHELDDLRPLWASANKSFYGSDATPAGRLRWLVVPITAADGSVSGAMVFGRFTAEQPSTNRAFRTIFAASLVAFAVVAVFIWWFANGRLSKKSIGTQPRPTTRSSHGPNPNR